MTGRHTRRTVNLALQGGGADSAEATVDLPALLD